MKKFYITGDFHGSLSRFNDFLYTLSKLGEKPAETAIVCLGDCGFNFYLNRSDEKRKTLANYLGITFYCVRGNHEQRPELIPGMETVFDTEVKGSIYMEPRFPHIRYLMDGETYEFEGEKCLVIGGAYSIDKWYRILRSGPMEENNDPKITGWFPDEMLTEKEMDNIFKNIKGQYFDMVLTHTCPISWEPIDTFLRQVDQNTVDKTMEEWLDKVAKAIKFRVWCFGHYHRDRAENPKAQMFYQDIFPLVDICEGTIARERGPSYH